MQNTDENSLQNLQSLYWTLVLGFIAIIFIVDLSLPAGIAVSFLYFIPLYASIFILDAKSAPFILFGVCSILTIIGATCSDFGGSLWREILNATLSFVMVAVGCLISYRDREIISESLRNEDLLRKKAEELEVVIAKLKRSNQDLDEFAYIASHDLKEPLRGLANNARFLLEDYMDKIDEAGCARLKRLGYLCERMERLVNDLLYFSRIGRQELAFQMTDLSPIIREIASLIDDPSMELSIIEPLPQVYCDRPRITEVFRNLITNAIKYNKKEKKTIEIGYLSKYPSPEGMQHDVFYVRDNGIGFEEQFYEDIFRIFKRLNEEDDSIKGTGAGLTFVRKIIERHQGKIWPESTPGKGSTFYFTLTSREDKNGKS